MTQLFCSISPYEFNLDYWSQLATTVLTYQQLSDVLAYKVQPNTHRNYVQLRPLFKFLRIFATVKSNPHTDEEFSFVCDLYRTIFSMKIRFRNDPAHELYNVGIDCGMCEYSSQHCLRNHGVRQDEVMFFWNEVQYRFHEYESLKKDRHYGKIFLDLQLSENI